jgi:hypothetical protein
MTAVYASLIAGIWAVVAGLAFTFRDHRGEHLAGANEPVLGGEPAEAVGEELDVGSPIEALLCGEIDPSRLRIDPADISKLIAPLEGLDDRSFIGIFSAMNPLTHPPVTPRLSPLPDGVTDFLDEWAALPEDGTHVEKCQALARLAWKTVQGLPQDVGDLRRTRDGDATYAWIVSGFLRVRIAGTIDGVSDDIPAAERYDWRIWMRRFPNANDSSRSPARYTHAAIMAMTQEQRIQALADINRDEYQSSIKNRKSATGSLLPLVKAAWLRRLRAVADAHSVVQ